MDSVSTVKDLAHVAALLKEHDRYLIVPHVAPDPDAFGSTCGLALVLKRLGKTAMVYTDETVLPNYRFLGEYFPISHELPADLASWKLIFVDGGERHREPAPVRELDTWMNIDHHQDNGQFAQWIYVDTQAAASALLIARIAEAAGVRFDEPIGSCLFTGLLFDTRGGFITDRCTPELFNIVARLVEGGARPDHLNRLLNEQMTMGDFRLYGEALAGLKTAAEGQIVYTALTRAMVEETGGGDMAMEMLTLNLPKIAGGEIFVLFRETEAGPVKISLRSKGRMAVNEIAKRFNGGGHKFASGARWDGSIQEAIAQLVGACEKAIEESLGVAR